MENPKQTKTQSSNTRFGLTSRPSKNTISPSSLRQQARELSADILSGFSEKQLQ
jgi:hypothetical protein